MSRFRKSKAFKFTGPEVLGRLYWDDKTPSPWAKFDTYSHYHKWRVAVRKARPGTKVEYLPHTDWLYPEDLLHAAVKEAKKERAAAKFINVPLPGLEEEAA